MQPEQLVHTWYQPAVSPEDVDRQTLIDYNRMTGCRYDVLGEFISYSWRRDCERL